MNITKHRAVMGLDKKLYQGSFMVQILCVGEKKTNTIFQHNT